MPAGHNFIFKKLGQGRKKFIDTEGRQGKPTPSMHLKSVPHKTL